MNKIKNYPINWTDGVRINKQHFLGHYYNMVETQKNIYLSSLNDFNYGVGEQIEGNIKNIEIETVKNSDASIIVKLKSCNAITRSGFHIIYYEGLYGDHVPMLTFQPSDMIDMSKQNLYIVVSVSPYSLVPVGEPDPDAIPLHHPYALPKIELSVISEHQANLSFLKNNFLVIGRLTIQKNSLSINADYIPPVQKICYYERLANFMTSLIKSLQHIKEYGLLVYRKNTINNKTNTLAKNTFLLCEDFNRFHNQYIFYLEHIVSQESPIHIARTISVLANYLSTSLNLMKERERESLLQYYYEWSNIKPSEITQIIGKIISINYNHLDIEQSILDISEFIAILERLFKKMSELEYIGLTRENIVVGADNENERRVNTKSRWSIID